jgi:SAM-dependent methyltransferase
MEMNATGIPSAPDIEEVRRFWDAHPLFAEECRYAPGEKGYFELLTSVRLAELSGSLDRIFTDGVEPTRDVLDAGCGPGFWVRQFCERGANVSACDLSQVAVQLTKRHLELFGLRADLRQGNAEALPYESESFDHVNCQGVIHHTPDTRQCIREFHRVLRPGGTLSVSVYYRSLPLRWSWLYRLISWLTKSWLGMSGRGRENMLHAKDAEELVRLYDGAENPIGRSYTRVEMERMLEGFEVLKSARFGFPRRILPIAMPDGFHRLLSRWLGLMLVVRCRKV